jgi:Family of unknown function (DUF6600)
MPIHTQNVARYREAGVEPQPERVKMTTSRSRTIVLALLLTLTGSVSTLRAQAPPPPQALPPPGEPQHAGQFVERTPPRLSFTQGEVSFWRPGAGDWTPAEINTPLAPGDVLYSGTGANLELQIGPRAFLRAGEGTQLGLENQEPDFLQFKVTSGHASVDLRGLPSGQTVELDTPSAAFTIGTTGYYRLDITDTTTTFVTRRGGRATVAPASGEASAVTPSEEVVVQSGENPTVESYVAPDLDAWDSWNYQRTDQLIDTVSERYVPPGVYGTVELDHYGSWRVMPNYGPVWIPQGVPSGWAPYSHGRWVWDPSYGWTWIDQAPWGWAPCHYGRWVFVDGFWGWAPGPLIAAPVYAPALVAFIGGPHFGVSIGIGAPAVGWVPLGWGEPLVPWWGPVGFIHVPWWAGWGGPRVVNRVVISRTTVVNVRDIHVYENLGVRNAVIAVREGRFGRGGGEFVRVQRIDPHQLEFMHGRLPVRPVAASLSPGVGHAPRPPEAVWQRSVVSTRAPHDYRASLRSAGLEAPAKHGPAPRIVSAPGASHPGFTARRPPFGQQGTAERNVPPLPPRYGERRPPGANAPSARAPAPSSREPAQRQPPMVGRRPSAPPPPAGGRAGSERAPAGSLPGQPANRLYRGRPAGRAARGAQAPRGSEQRAPRREEGRGER